ncbi:non-specific serine/threonine protein kinase [Entamoeba marina]
MESPEHQTKLPISMFPIRSSYTPTRRSSLSPLKRVIGEQPFNTLRSTVLVSEEFEVCGLKSEIVIETMTGQAIIVHQITISVNGKILSTTKSASELFEFDGFLRKTNVNFPPFPKRSISYPMRDTALLDYLQGVFTLKGISNDPYVTQWFNSTQSSFVSLKRPAIEGELQKEGYVLKRFVGRYCLLKRNYFIYFVSEKEQRKLRIPHVLNLNNAVIKLTESSKTFHIKLSNNSVYTFKAESKEVATEWVIALQTAVITPVSRDNTEDLVLQCKDQHLMKLILKFPKKLKKIVGICKHLETKQFLDDGMLSSLYHKLSLIVAEHPEDTLLLRLLHLLPQPTQQKKTRSRSGSRTRNSSRNNSFGSRSNQSSPITSPIKFTLCRVCEVSFKVEDLAKHSFYCQICNDICEKCNTDSERVKGILNELKRQKQLKKTSGFEVLIQLAIDVENLMSKPIQLQHELFSAELQKMKDLNGDVVFYTFIVYLKKIVQHKMDIVERYLKDPSNPFEYLNVLSAGIQLEERWNAVNLDDFEILKRFNEGAYSRVYLVRKKTTKDVYAMKVSKKSDMIRKNVVDGTASVVKLFYAFQDAQNLFLVMEYCPGGDLRCLLSNLGRLDETFAKVYAAEIVVALEYIHSLGCIHRDLKPDNVLIDRNGHLLLTDFGLSVVGSKIEQKAVEDSRLICTPDYVAPESIISFQYSRSSDYFSLGCIIYEFVVGFPPFHEETPDRIFANIRTKQFTWPNGINVSNMLKDIVNNLLETEPKLRLGHGGIFEIKIINDRSDVFVPELYDDTDTGYFNTTDPTDICLLSSPAHEKVQFEKFDIVSTRHLMDETMSIVDDAIIEDYSTGSESTEENENENINEDETTNTMFDFLEL